MPQKTSELFLTLLTLMLIGLKLTGYITWSWFWVLAPLWSPFAIAGVIFAFLGAWYLIERGMK